MKYYVERRYKQFDAAWFVYIPGLCVASWDGCGWKCLIIPIYFIVYGNCPAIYPTIFINWQ